MGLVVVLDFDGTVTRRDVGDELCERFAPPAWREIDAAWVRNEISLPDAQRRMWRLVRCDRRQAVAYACEVAGGLRPGLDALFDGVARSGGAVWLASGGFDFYIEAILDGRMRRFGRAFYNGAKFVDGGVDVEFPLRELACSRCAVCKGKVCDLARAAGARVVFAGGGASDRCVLGRADRVCAVRGSLLEQTCRERGVDCFSFDTLDEVLATLDSPIAAGV